MKPSTQPIRAHQAARGDALFSNFRSCAVLLSCLALPALGQTGVARPADEKPALALGADPEGRNTLGARLRPLVAANKVKVDELYAPIKKIDDIGQVPELEMFVGESRVFPAPGVARIAVGNGQIMSAAALDDKEVIVFANGVGTSSLFIWNEDGRYQRIKLNIVPGDTSRIAREVAAFLATIPHARASIVGDKVIVEGDELSDADREKVKELALRYPQIVNFTSPIGWEKMVMMDVKVVEFPRIELREIGLQWSATGGAALAGIWSPVRRGSDGPYQLAIPSSGSVAPISAAPGPDGVAPIGTKLPSGLNILGGLNLGIEAKLNLLEQNGVATILAEPQLSTRNGYKASFLAGGEFPYSIATLTGVTVAFKPYGIKLDIEPKIGRNNVIRAVIDAEVSSIDSSVTSAAGPALLTRRTKTEFNVKAGETIVLSGLLQRTSSNDIDKVPLLGDIPVLGALFRSKRFQNKETELVVFVTSTIVDARTPALVERVEKAGERLEQNLGRAPYLSAPLQPAPVQSSEQPGDEQQQPPAPGMPKAATKATTMPTVARPAALPILDAAATGGEAVAPALAVSTAAIATSSTAAPGVAVSPPGAGSMNGGSTLRVKIDGLVLRESPSVHAPALLELGRNALVQLGHAARTKANSSWRNVVVGQFKGWVRAEGVEPTRLDAIAAGSTQGPVAGKDQAGIVLTLGTSLPGPAADEAGQVTANLQAGLPANLSAKVGAQPSTAHLPQYRVTLQNLALLVSPDTNALVIRHLDEGDLVDALPQEGRENWIAVQVNHQRGWLARQWLAALPVR